MPRKKKVKTEIPWTPNATIKVDEKGVHVNVAWTGPFVLDRPDVGGWAFDADQKGIRLADRLYRAINAGAVFRNPTVMKDVNGHTYISATQNGFFHKRHMNASLIAIGF